MPDVGTLSLTIESNAGKAVEGLGQVADALTRIKTAIPNNGIGLSSIAKELNLFAKQVNQAKATNTVLQNIANFGKGLKDMTSAIKATSKDFDTTKITGAIDAIKTSVGDGIKLGQSGTQMKNLKEALGGVWNTDNAYQAGIALSAIGEGAKSLKGADIGKKATSISKLAAALNEITEATERAKSVFGEGGSSVANGLNMDEYVRGADGVWNFAPEKARPSFMKFNPQQFGRKKIIESISDAKVPEGLEQLEHVEEYAVRLNVALRETGDIVESIIIPHLQEMYQIWSAMAYEFNMFQMQASRLMSGESPLLLGDGKTPGQLLLGDGSDAETFLSTWVQVGEQWKQNWVYFASEAAEEMRAYFQPDWIMGGQPVAQSMSTFHLGSGESPLLLGAGGVDPEKSLSTMVDYTEQWKQDWIYVDGTVSDVVEEVGQVASVTETAAQSVEHVTSAVESATKETARYYSSLEDAFNGIRNGKKVQNDLMSFWLHGGGTAKEQLYALKTISNELNMTIDEVKHKLNELLAAEGSSFRFSFGDSADDAKKLSEEVENASRSMSELIFGAEGLNGAFKRLFPTVSGLLKRFEGMAKMRAMRYIIRQIAAGVSEGLKNVYKYSDAMGGTFAKSMDNMSTSLLKMKNSIGAALAPALQALIPYIQTVVNWFIAGINYINQFFALLRGQSTWTKAVDYQTKAYDDNTKAAKGAAQAAKDLLADWDELNIIQSQGGGGGGGAGGKEEPNYAEMFREVGEYDSWIKGLVDGINDQFGSILNFAKRIGIAILGWKVSEAFAGVIGTIGALIAAAGILDIVFNLTAMFDNKYFDTGENGWLIANVLTTMLGGVLMKRVLKNVLGGNLAKLAIPLTLSFSALADIITLIGRNDVSAISKEGISSSVVSALKVGGAASYLAKTTMGVSLKTALSGGLALAVATFGAIVGIKTVVQAHKSGVTKDTFKGTAISSLAMGLGTAGFALAAHATLAGALGLGGLATIGTGLVIAAAIGISALLKMNEEDPVKWGDYEATEKQIKDYVEGQVFTTNPSAILSIIDPLIEVRSTAEEGLQAKVDQVKLLSDKISLGIDDTSVLNDLEKQIFGDGGDDKGLIAQFKDTAKAHKEVIETGIILVPTTTNEDGTPKELIDRSGDAWNLLTDHMASLGEELSAHLGKAYEKGIDEETKQMEMRTISDLTLMMTNIANAITRGEQYEELMQDLEANIENLSQGSWNKLFDYIDEYGAGIAEAYAKTYDETTVSMAGLVSGLRQSWNNELELARIADSESERDKHLSNAKAYEDEYNYWNEELKLRRAGRQAAIDNAVKEAMDEESVERIRSIIASKIDKTKIEPSDVRGLQLSDDAWTALFNSKGERTSFAKDQASKWLDDLIDAAFGGDAETIKKAVHTGMLGYGDIFSKEVITALASEIGITEQNQGIQNAWNNLVAQLFGAENANKSSLADRLGITDRVNAAKAEVEKFRSWLEELNKLTITINFKTLLDGAPTEGSFFGLGNIDLNNRKVLNNPDGSFSTEKSTTVEFDGQYVVIPTIVNGQELDIESAVQHYMDTGEHLGIFGSQGEADTYAQLLHERQEQLYGGRISDTMGNAWISELVEDAWGSFREGKTTMEDFLTTIEQLKRTYDPELIQQKYEEVWSRGTGANSNKKLGDLAANHVVADVDFTKGSTNMLAQYGKNEPVKTEPSNPSSEINNVATGVQRGTADLASALSQLLTVVRSINQKDFVVNVMPSAPMGRMIRQSGDSYGLVTGDYSNI